MMELKTYIGSRVRLARRRARLTQEQLAHQIDKNVVTLSNLERGHSLTSIETLELIAGQVNVSLAYFFERSERRSELDERHLELEAQLLEILDDLSPDQMTAIISVAKSLRDST